MATMRGSDAPRSMREDALGPEVVRILARDLRTDVQATVKIEMREDGFFWVILPDGTGVGLVRDPSNVGIVADLVQGADQVSEVVQEALAPFGRSNWPECPAHPGAHPMQARNVDGAAVWLCPANRDVVARVGCLDAK